MIEPEPTPTEQPKRKVGRAIARRLFGLVLLVLVLVLVLVIIWAVGELKIHGFLPKDAVTSHAATLAAWINKHLGGAK